MNMQNNDDVSVNEEKLNNRLSSDTEECIKLEGERAPVKKDAKTVNDDANDYLFLKSYKKVRRVTKDEIRNENGSGENFTIVKSSHSSARHSRKKNAKSQKRQKNENVEKGRFGRSLHTAFTGCFDCRFYCTSY
ncbi:MAG: hypothetical protein LUF33_03085 [Clostridiales bacterium]|nr:hypothetical protein [Clostridiales bacterium]